MLLKDPEPRMKTYTISLTKEERAEIRRKKKNLSPFRKKFDEIERQGRIRKMRERIGEPWDRCSNHTRRRKMY